MAETPGIEQTRVLQNKFDGAVALIAMVQAGSPFGLNVDKRTHRAESLAPLYAHIASMSVEDKEEVVSALGQFVKDVRTKVQGLTQHTNRRSRPNLNLEEVLVVRYGLSGDLGKTLEATAQQFNTNMEQIRKVVMIMIIGMRWFSKQPEGTTAWNAILHKVGLRFSI